VGFSLSPNNCVFMTKECQWPFILPITFVVHVQHLPSTNIVSLYSTYFLFYLWVHILCVCLCLGCAYGNTNYIYVKLCTTNSKDKRKYNHGSFYLELYHRCNKRITQGQSPWARRFLIDMRSFCRWTASVDVTLYVLFAHINLDRGRCSFDLESKGRKEIWLSTRLISYMYSSTTQNLQIIQIQNRSHFEYFVYLE